MENPTHNASWLNDSLEVQSESQLDSFDANSSCDENIDAHALNEELSENHLEGG